MQRSTLLLIRTSHLRNVVVVVVVVVTWRAEISHGAMAILGTANFRTVLPTMA